MAVIAAVGLTIAYATYRHNVDRDKQQQISTPPATMLPAFNTGPSVKPAGKQPEKGPDNPEQKAPDSPPVDTPKESPKDKPTPFTFWGYFQAGQGQPQRQGILFQVDRCNIDRILVTCIMTATSAQYDRVLYFDMLTTTITDSDGDVFKTNFRLSNPLQLDRNAAAPFKLEFPVTKDLVRPVVVRLNGYAQGSGSLQNASFVIGPK